MKNIILGLILVILKCFILHGQAPIVADHSVAKLSTLNNIPLTYITAAKTNLHIAYEHTSHGEQIVQGMSGLVNWKGTTYAFNNGGTGGALDFRDHAISPWRWSDLGTIRDPNNYVYNTYDWARITRDYLNKPENSIINVVIWSWCSEVSSISIDDIDTYLYEANKLEQDYPNIKFVYMTGHVDGTPLTSILYRNNKRIRDYCIANNKILYDFADIESYDPDDNYFGDKRVTDCCNYDYNGDGVVSTDGGDPGLPTGVDRNWALDWQNNHTLNVDWYNCSSSHSYPLNANKKTYAIWWLFARLSGWNGMPITIPTISTTTISSITTNSAISGGNTILNGNSEIIAKGVCWNTSANPTISNSKTNDGTGVNNFTSSIINLQPNTLYYVRAYATNSVGTAYGNQISFTTNQELFLPVLTTTPISLITKNSAVSGGEISFDGNTSIINKGICWNTSTNPTIENNKTSDGTGINSFISNITNLQPNTLYYVRAYATNNVGTSYGNEFAFRTLPLYLLTSINSVLISTHEKTTSEFWIASNTDWKVTSQDNWIKISVKLYYTENGQAYVTLPYSGTAPDIGAFEYLQEYATGHDTAIVILNIDENILNSSRSTNLIISGTGIVDKIIPVTQTGAPIILPDYLIYVTSKNISSNIIEVIYNQPLANIKPSVSSFKITINGNVALITNMSIQNEKILITLKNQINTSDTITFSYIKPILNPIQTPNGIEAENLSFQQVTHSQ